MNEIVNFCKTMKDNGKSSRLKLYIYPEVIDGEVVELKIRFAKNAYKQDGPNGAWYKTLAYYIQGNGFSDGYTALTSDAAAYAEGIVDIAINPHNPGYSEEKILELLRNLTNQTFPNVLRK